MEYRIEIGANETVVQLSGRLTFNDHVPWRALIHEMSRDAAKNQTMDLGALEFVDSAGIGMLLIAREEMSAAGKHLSLRNAKGQVKRVLNVAQINKLIPIHD